MVCLKAHSIINPPQLVLNNKMVLTLIEMVRVSVRTPIVLAEATIPIQIVMALAKVKVKVKACVKATVSQIR